MSKKLKIGDRVLRVIERPNDHEEATIVEISICGKWIKYVNRHNFPYWCKIEDFKVITYLDKRQAGD